MEENKDFLNSFKKIFEFINLDEEMHLIFKRNNFKSIINEIENANLDKPFESAFETKNIFLKFKHPYTVNFSDKEILTIFFYRGATSYNLSFNVKTFDDYTNEELRKSNIYADNKIFEMNCYIEDAEIGETSRIREECYLQHNNKTILMKTTKYSLEDGLSYKEVDGEIQKFYEKYNHPVEEFESLIQIPKNETVKTKE